MQDIVLRMEGICKSFPGVKALDNVNLEVRRSEVHAIIGENGAGKSTLMKVLNGIYLKDEGHIYIEGKEVDLKNTRDAMRLKIAIIHQELMMAENITIAENIFMGREFMKGAFVDMKRMNLEASKILDAIGVPIDPNSRISGLSTSLKQVVEIAKALSLNANILVMDEPTAALTDNEVHHLFETIERLKQQGCSIIYISHRMEEIFTIADNITVLRDGKYIGTRGRDEFDRDALISMMVGRDMTKYYTHTAHYTDEKVLEVNNLKSGDKLQDVSVYLRKGEILGVAGLIGAGRSEMVRAIYGIDYYDSGEIIINGEKADIKRPADAIKKGIALVSEDRKAEGLILVRSVGFNITLMVLNTFMRFIMRDKKKEDNTIEEFFKKLRIKASSPDQIVGDLSGGNQQKAVLAKCLATKPSILILDEPTRGIDVGAKEEIYEIMDDLAKQGVSIIMISSEMLEVVNMSDRVYIMYAGEIAGCDEGDDINQEKIVSYATGVITDG